MITNEQCFAIWAPDAVIWSEWAKPTLFASAGSLFSDQPLAIPALSVAGIPEAWASAAIVIDLPGAESVAVSLALAERGFRPVPLFNNTSGPSPVIDTQALVDALGAGTTVLQAQTLKPDARPAFLVDSRRSVASGAGEPGRYDNRWIVLPQDFPSAAFLGNHGIKDVTLIQRGGLTPATDLSHVLLRWREGGIRLRAIDLDSGASDDNLTVSPPSWFRRAWYVAIALMGLRRSNVGGFGSMVPERTSSGSGFYG